MIRTLTLATVAAVALAAPAADKLGAGVFRVPVTVSPNKFSVKDPSTGKVKISNLENAQYYGELAGLGCSRERRCTADMTGRTPVCAACTARLRCVPACAACLTLYLAHYALAALTLPAPSPPLLPNRPHQHGHQQPAV